MADVPLKGITLSALLALPADQAPDSVVGLVVDQPEFSPPPGLSHAGVLYVGTPDGVIDDDVLDVIISFALAGVEITLEIPTEAPAIDPAYILNVATNAALSIAILAPEEETPEAQDAFVACVTGFADAYFKQQNFSRYLYPLTNYLEFLIVEALTGVEALTPDDAYTVARYSDMSPELVDRFKAALRAQIFDAFGGQDAFRTFAKTLAHRVRAQTQAAAEDLVRQRLEAAESSGAESGGSGSQTG